MIQFKRPARGFTGYQPPSASSRFSAEPVASAMRLIKFARKTPGGVLSRDKQGGFSLIEVVITMTILAILVTFAAPSVVRTMEQSHADLAGAGLRSIATAQRFFWLENRVYADNLQQLIDAELVDAPMVNVSPRYEFAITNADANGFTATAQRRSFNSAGNAVYNGAYQGTFSIDESGDLAGTIAVAGRNSTIQPGF